MPPAAEPPPPAPVAAVLAEVDAQLDQAVRWRGPLAGGEQTGAHLVRLGDQPAVLKWEPAGWRAEQLLRAHPVVVAATRAGWPAARWLAAGRLGTGGAFVLQEQVPGDPVRVVDGAAAAAVVAAHALGAGRGSAAAVDDSAQLAAVLSGDHPWKQQVAGRTAAGAALVAHGDAVAAAAGAGPWPGDDVIHGDFSSSNLLLDPVEGTVRFVDCQTIGRGTRVRDLADLYRQTFLHPHPGNTGAALLRAAGVAAEGPGVFTRCAVAVTYNNLAWWAEHRPAAAFDQACARLHGLLDDLRDLRPGGRGR